MRRQAAFALALALLVAFVALADARVVPRRSTLIASPPPEAGRTANGPSGNPAWSQDERIARLMAFDSEASNLVGNDDNQQADVFVLRRGSRQGDVGGDLEIASVNSSGEQANGESRNPSLDGLGRRVRPHCVAFESTATNLAAGDAEADSDVFVRDLTARRTQLVSPGVANARNASIDGRCRTVVFEADGAIYAAAPGASEATRVAEGTDPDQQTDGGGVAYVRGDHVYYRRLRGARPTGRELLVDRGPRGAGNGESRNPVMDDAGHYVAFDSTATNLCNGSGRFCRGARSDRNRGTRDVFRRTISRRAPSRDQMQMVSFSYGVRAQGNRASYDPAMTGGGEFVFFTSEASNLRESRGIREPDPNGSLPDVYLWNFPARRGYGNVSRESRPAPRGALNGGSTQPATSNRGNYIAFVSEATDAPGDGNGRVPDVFNRFLGGR